LYSFPVSPWVLHLCIIDVKLRHSLVIQVLWNEPLPKFCILSAVYLFQDSLSFLSLVRDWSILAQCRSDGYYALMFKYVNNWRFPPCTEFAANGTNEFSVLLHDSPVIWVCTKPHDIFGPLLNFRCFIHLSFAAHLPLLHY
jgi:hypothetical protein